MPITFTSHTEAAHTYLVCRFDTCYLIDPSDHDEAIKEALAGRRLAGILLTHAHSDHVHLIGEFDAPVFIHKADAHLLFEDAHNGYAPGKHPYKKRLLDLRYVDDGQRLPLADHAIEVLHTPGHTKGSVSYLYDRDLFTGDTLFQGSVGRHDLYSGSLPELKKSIIRLLSLPGGTRIHPGHDAPTTIRHEHKNNPFYQKWHRQIKR